MHNGGMERSSTPWGTAARLVFGLVAVASGVGALDIAQGPGRATTYAGHSDLAATLALGAGFALVLAGLVISFGPQARRIGDVVLLAGFEWFAPVWIGWEAGPPIVRSLGMLSAGFIFPLLLHAVLAYPGGRVGPTAGRVLLGAAYFEASVTALGRALFRDPFFDPNCWANCTDNVFLVRSFPGLARAIEVTELWFVAAAAAAFATICGWRLLRHSGPARRALLPVVAPAMLLAGAIAAHSIALHRMPLEDPSDPAFFSIFVITSVAVALLAAGLVWASLRTRLQRRAVARIVTTLGEAPPAGTLESALARALGDAELQIAYWLPHSRRYVDANGQPVAEPVATAGRAVTTLVRDERRVALVSHAAGLSEVESEMGPAVRLALENERLQAEGLAQLAELRASRTRIVETGDAERRRLERDLHDGAQQRLLAVSYDIRLARTNADTDGDVQTGSFLAAALDGVQAALDELRELAHGIYPAILEEAGLAAALATLADTAPLQVRIADVDEERYSASVETGAYLLVVEAIEDAAARGATRATVTATRDDERLVVIVQDDGSKRTSEMVRLADRVGALDGSLEVGPMMLRAEIPCE
jgi:signal transduction histidine kinase